MKRLNVFVLAGLIFFPLPAVADSAISWKNIEEYRDIEAIDESQEKFQNRIFKKLETHLAQLSERLPVGQKLWLKVTDLDLAGRVLPGFAHGLDTPQDVRMIKSIDYPKISFSYHLTDTEGNVLLSGEESLKDLAFQDKLHTRRMAKDSLGYEKRMLKEWFRETFPQQVATK